MDFKNEKYIEERFPVVKDGLLNVMANLNEATDCDGPNVKATEYLLDSTNWLSYEKVDYYWLASPATSSNDHYYIWTWAIYSICRR